MAIRKKDLPLIEYYTIKEKGTNKIRCVTFPNPVCMDSRISVEEDSVFSEDLYVFGDLHVCGSIDVGETDVDGANVGGAEGEIFRDKTGTTLNFKTLNAGANITITNNADTIDIAATGGGGDPDASYIVVGLTGSLSNERALTEGTGIDFTDGGANSTFTIAIDNDVVATVSGTTFTGDILAPVVSASIGFSGSLTRLLNGTSYLISSGGIVITSQSNGSIIINYDPSADNYNTLQTVTDNGNTTDNDILPLSDGAANIGSHALRWLTVFAGSGTFGDTQIGSANTNADDLVVGSRTDGLNHGITIFSTTTAQSRIHFGNQIDNDATVIGYIPASQRFFFVVSGTQHLNLDVNSHLGPHTNALIDLGTTSARWDAIYGYDLDLADDATIAGDLTFTGAASTIFLGTTTSGNAQVRFNKGNTNNQTTLRWDMESSARWLIQHDTSENLNILNQEAALIMRFNTGTNHITARTIYPIADLTYLLGTSSLRWESIYGRVGDFSGSQVRINNNTGTAISRADDLVIGNFDNDYGITIFSAETGSSSIIFGNGNTGGHGSSSVNRGQIVYRHNGDDLDVYVGNTRIFAVTSDGIEDIDGGHSLGNIVTPFRFAYLADSLFVNYALDATSNFGENIVIGNSSETAGGLSIITSPAGAAYLIFGDNNDSDAGWVSYNHSTGALSLKVGGSERVRINTSSITLFTSSAGSSYVIFGDNADDDVAWMSYNHVSNSFFWNVSAAERLELNTGSILPFTDLAMSLGNSSRIFSGTWTKEVWSSQVALTDGVAEPSTSTGNAQMYVDSADGSLKVKYANGVVAQIAHDVASCNVAQVDQENEDQNVVSSSAITTVFSYVIPAGTMGANGEIRGLLVADYLNNTGSGRNLTVRVTFGGVEVMEMGIFNILSQANRRAFLLEFKVVNQNNVAAQSGYTRMTMSYSTSAATGTGGPFDNPGQGSERHLLIVHADSTINTDSASRTVAVTVQNSTASSALSFRKRFAQIDVVHRP